MIKLKKPIVVTITHVENAICVAIESEGGYLPISERHSRIAANAAKEVFSQIESALLAQGIDYRTWEPPHPLIINGSEAVAHADGSVNIGFHRVDRQTIEAVLKLSSEAMGKAEPEWPKYYGSRCSKGCFVAKSENDIDFVYSDGRKQKQSYSHSTYANDPDTFPPLTPLQAREILEAKG